MNKKWNSWREETRRIADEIRQSGQQFPNTTELLREDRDAAEDCEQTWAEADRIFEEFKATGRKFSDTTELLREDRKR